jgi:hypothetical protein
MSPQKCDGSVIAIHFIFTDSMDSAPATLIKKYSSYVCALTTSSNSQSDTGILSEHQDKCSLSASSC